MKKSILRGWVNRWLHLVARLVPLGLPARVRLHRLRGVVIGSDVFIGDEVYLENEYPECIEIGDGAQISMRAMLLAHTRGPGRIVIGPEAYIGPGCIVVAAGGQTLHIGAGAVVGAGVVITRDVGEKVFIPHASAKPIARVTYPLTTAGSIDKFILGLVPISRNSSTTGAAEKPDAPPSVEKL